jgi:hypothetical protein
MYLTWSIIDFVGDARHSPLTVGWSSTLASQLSSFLLNPKRFTSSISLSALGNESNSLGPRYNNITWILLKSPTNKKSTSEVTTKRCFALTPNPTSIALPKICPLPIPISFESEKVTPGHHYTCMTIVFVKSVTNLRRVTFLSQCT